MSHAMLGRQVEDSNDSLLEGMLVPFPAKRRHFSIPSVVAHDHIGTCSHIKKEGLQLLACLDRSACIVQKQASLKADGVSP